MGDFKKIIILLAALLSGCATAKPYVELKGVVQNEEGSDWMLRSARSWVHDKPFVPRLHLQVGLEWPKRYDCPYIATGTESLNWVHVGCTKTFGKYEPGQRFNFISQFSVVHQVDELSSWWLSTDRKDWAGHNPFYHVRVGMEWKNKIKCPVFATGRSMFQGRPFESEAMAPDLYWSTFECGKRWGGKR